MISEHAPFSVCISISIKKHPEESRRPKCQEDAISDSALIADDQHQYQAVSINAARRRTKAKRIEIGKETGIVKITSAIDNSIC